MAARNILLIIADQWRGDSLGVLGHPAARTPNLDALARDGVVFRNHYAQSAPCGPARASLLTGLYVMNHRVVANGIPQDRRHATMPGALRAAGLDPALIGYTTTIPDPRDAPPADPRFREIGDVLDGFTPYAHLDEVEFRSYFGWVSRQGHTLPPEPTDIWLPESGPPGPTDAPSRIPAALSDTAWSGEHALDFLRSTRADHPWMLHLGFYRPHPPFIAPAPYHSMIPAAAIPPPLRAASLADEAAQHPVLARWLAARDLGNYFHAASGRTAELDAAAITRTRRAYFGLIAEIDVWVGKIIEELKRSGQYDDTLIIFTSDHGEQLGDHYLLGKLGWFDQSYHLPLIIRDPSPEADRGRSVSAFTESIDLMPTMMQWLGAPPPACDGASLLPWLRGATPSPWRDAVHFEYDLRGGWPGPSPLPPEADPEAGPHAGALAVMRTAEWKYVHIAGMAPLLYDLAADPGECHNLAASPGHQALLLHAAQRMLTWRLAHAERGFTHMVTSPAGLVPR
jgi:arylsulfatase A-like enzyme